MFFENSFKNYLSDYFDEMKAFMHHLHMDIEYDDKKVYFEEIDKKSLNIKDKNRVIGTASILNEILERKGSSS